DALLSDATKIAESLVVQLDEGLGIKGPEGQAHVHQTRTRQHEDHKVQDALPVADPDPTHLAGIHLALDAGHGIHHRLVITPLTGGYLLLEGLHIAPDTAI